LRRLSDGGSRACHNPSVDESFARLHRAGWSIGETTFGSDHALVWIVTGAIGENFVESKQRHEVR
jgi:hypothetical protein